MLYTHELYNTLPSLHDARIRLESVPGGATNLLNKVAPILKNHPQFGICLIHAHCTLTNGEKMIATGRISEPKIVSDEACFAERWLANGIPYEFSSTPTVEGGAPPADLVSRFEDRLTTLSKDILGPESKEDLTSLLGIYYVHDPDSDSEGSSLSSVSEPKEDVVWMERTEGRRNILRPVPREKASEVPNTVPAAWFVTTDKGAGATEDDWIISVRTACGCVESGVIHTRKWTPPDEQPGDDISCDRKRSLVVDFAGLE